MGDFHTQGTRTYQDSSLDTNMKPQKNAFLKGFFRAVERKIDVDTAYRLTLYESKKGYFKAKFGTGLLG